MPAVYKCAVVANVTQRRLTFTAVDLLEKNNNNSKGEGEKILDGGSGGCKGGGGGGSGRLYTTFCFFLLLFKTTRNEAHLTHAKICFHFLSFKNSFTYYIYTKLSMVVHWAPLPPPT